MNLRYRLQPYSGSISLNVVGESHSTESLARISKLVGEQRVVAVLVPDPDNQADRNAVKVMLQHAGVNYPAGYLARDTAAALSRTLRDEAASGVLNAINVFVSPFESEEGPMLYSVKVVGPAALARGAVYETAEKIAPDEGVSDSRRSDILSRAVSQYIKKGWATESVSSTQAVLVKTKRIGLLWNVILVLVTGGLWLIYIIYRALNRKTSRMVLFVNELGVVETR